MDLTALNSAVLELPWLLRAYIGHFLPLLVAVLCLWHSRSYWRTEPMLAWSAAALACGWLLWITAKEIRTPVPGGVMIAVQLTPAIPVLLTLVAAFVAAKRLDYKAVFAGVFLPLYVVDVLCSVKVFGDWADGLHAIGGAGPLDGLLLMPTLAVAAAWAVGRDKAVWRKLVATRT